MTNEDNSLGSLFRSSENKRQKLDHLPSALDPEYQPLLEAAIGGYRQCLETADRVSLFSPNETIEDVSTNNIQYLLINYRLAALQAKQVVGPNRKAYIRQSQASYESFLKTLDAYGLLGKDNFSMLERFQEKPDSFSTVSSNDPTARRESKIRRFKEEKDLKQRLEYWRSKSASSHDEEIARQLYLQLVSLAVHETFQALEMHAQELHIISLAPPAPSPFHNSSGPDLRDRARDGDGYSERLDGGPSHLSAGLKGPLLDANGRPLRPFTLLDKRQQLQQGVFRPDHNLPTMSIDEYLEEERKRGGIIEGGGPQSGMRPEPNEDDIEKADAETLKARAWDDYKDDNPKGAGNTLNRG